MNIAHPAPSSTTDSKRSSRAERALELYRTRRHEIRRVGGDLYLVPSCSGRGFYAVTYGGDVEACDCPDHAHHPERACKHILAVGVHRAKRRGTTLRNLTALEESYRHELMDEDERQELRDRVLRLRRRLGL